jgi:hypothetical protein
MKALITISLLFLTLYSSFGSINEIISIRQLYYSSVESKTNTEKLVETLKHITIESDAIQQGYKGMSLLLVAKHSWNPITKNNNFRQGLNWLESAIAKDTSSIELRFLRYSVQCNAPLFLNYSDKIVKDKKYIMKNYKKLDDRDLKNRISNYLTLEMKIK